MGLTPKESKNAFVFLSGGRFTSMFIQAALLVWFASLSNVEEISWVLTWFSLALLLSGLTDLGFGILLTKLGAESKTAQKAALALDTKITSALILCVLLFSVVMFFGLEGIHPPEFILVPAALCLWGLIETLVEAGALVLVSAAKTAKAGLAITFRRLLALVFFPVFLLWTTPGLAFASSLLCGALVLYFFVPRAFSTKGISSYLPKPSEIGKYALSSGSGQLRLLEAPLVTWLFSVTMSSSFLLSSRLAGPLFVLTGSLGTAVLAVEKKLSFRLVQFVILTATSTTSLVILLLLYSTSSLAEVASSVVTWFDEESAQVFLLVFLRYFTVGIVGVLNSILVKLGKIDYSVKSSLFVNIAGLSVLLVFGLFTKDLVLALLFSSLIAILQIAAMSMSLHRFIRETAGE